MYHTGFSQPRSKGCLIFRQTALRLKFAYNFINFVISLLATIIIHYQGNCRRLPRRLLKPIKRFIELICEIVCWGLAEINDIFKLLPHQLYCRQLYCWNSNAVIRLDISPRFVLLPALYFVYPSWLWQCQFLN